VAQTNWQGAAACGHPRGVHEDQRKLTLEQAAYERWAEFDGPERRMVPATPLGLTEQSTAVERF
jgi:hypothetical protein